jgi:hypothetical protein
MFLKSIRYAEECFQTPALPWKQGGRLPSPISSSNKMTVGEKHENSPCLQVVQ